MPQVNLLPFERPYVATSSVAAARGSALNLISQLLALEGVNERHLKDQLSSGLWKWTEADGISPHPKYNLRFVTGGVLASDGSDHINHEHVWTRRWLIGQLRGSQWDPASLRVFLERHGVACVVTVGEHAALGNQTGEGWRRYRNAGIEVWDRLTGAPVDLEHLEETGEVVVAAPPGRPESTVGDEMADDSVEDLVAANAAAGVRDHFRRFLRMAHFASSVAAPSYMRTGRVSKYFRIHDTLISEPTPAVAFPHWSGTVHYRLTVEDLPTELRDDPRVTAIKSAKYAVGCKVVDELTQALAEELLFVALEKLRAGYDL